MMKSDIAVLSLMIVTVLVLTSWSIWGPDDTGNMIPDKLDLSTLEAIPHVEETKSGEITPEIPSVSVPDSKENVRQSKITYPLDTTAQNILFIGDSMLEGLSRRFISYADENGHDLHTVIWYSSTSEAYATTDTLDRFIKKYNPTFVVICLCGNELFVRDIPKREKYIHKIVEKLGDIPFLWISPPNWKKDTGINDAIIRVVGSDRYFDSTNLDLERKADHAHPTYPAAAKWMDLIAEWMQSDSVRTPIIMHKPSKDSQPRNVVALKPYKQ